MVGHCPELSDNSLTNGTGMLGCYSPLSYDDSEVFKLLCYTKSLIFKRAILSDDSSKSMETGIFNASNLRGVWF